MNYRIIAPESVTYEVNLPASKSISNRALIIKFLAGNSSRLFNVAKCDDTDAMLSALNSKALTHINIGAAGTAMRFLTAYFAVQEGREVFLDGSERMHHRPIKVLVDALRSCGASIEYSGEEGFPPLRIKGAELNAESITLEGNVSSQYISAILMIAPLINGLKRIILSGNIISRPYIDMTLSIMNKFGVYTHIYNNEIVFDNATQYSPLDFHIENDWSASSYWFQIQALLYKSHITLKGLFNNSTQGDSAVARLFENFGVSINRHENSINLKTETLVRKQKIELNLLENPDLAQTIIVTACLLDCPFHITGLQTLRIKETDRIEALRSQLLKLGYVLNIENDYSLQWNGEKCSHEKEIRIDTFDDHRMAMAFAPAAIKFPGIIINDIEVVSKSYPDYWNHLKSAGFKLEEVK